MGVLSRRIMGGLMGYRSWRIFKVSGAWFQISEISLHELVGGEYGPDLLPGLTLYGDGTFLAGWEPPTLIDGNLNTGISSNDATYVRMDFPRPVTPRKFRHYRQANMSYDWTGYIQHLNNAGAWISVSPLITSSYSQNSVWIDVTW